MSTIAFARRAPKTSVAVSILRSAWARKLALNLPVGIAQLALRVPNKTGLARLYIRQRRVSAPTRTAAIAGGAIALGAAGFAAKSLLD